MRRSAEERFSDILAAIDRRLEHKEHLGGGDAVLARMAMDAVLRDLAVIGEAVRALPGEERDVFVAVPWAAIAGLRNVIVHGYFRIQPELIIGILDEELIPLADALRTRRH